MQEETSELLNSSHTWRVLLLISNKTHGCIVELELRTRAPGTSRQGEIRKPRNQGFKVCPVRGVLLFPMCKA